MKNTSLIFSIIFCQLWVTFHMLAGVAGDLISPYVNPYALSANFIWVSLLCFFIFKNVYISENNLLIYYKYFQVCDLYQNVYFIFGATMFTYLTILVIFYFKLNNFLCLGAFPGYLSLQWFLNILLNSLWAFYLIQWWIANCFLMFHIFIHIHICHLIYVYFDFTTKYWILFSI